MIFYKKIKGVFCMRYSKTLLTQKTIIQSKLKYILKALKNVNKSSNKFFVDDLI